MSRQKTPILFNASEHLQAEELDAHASGIAAPEIKRKVEMHIIDCPMCDEALNGAIWLNNSKKKKLADYTFKPKPTAATYYWRVAASLFIILFAGGGLLWWQKEQGLNTRLAEEIKVVAPPSQKEATSTHEEIIPPKEEPITSINNKQILPKSLARSEVDVAEQVTKSLEFESLDLSKTDKEGYDKQSEDDESSDDLKNINLALAPSEEKTKFSQPSAAAGGVEDNTLTESNTKQLEDIIVKEVETSSKRKLQAAVPTFKKGYQVYKRNRFDSAIAIFLSVPSNSEDYEKARYYLALCYINTSQSDKAKSILEQLANQAHPISGQARITLDSLMK